MRLLDRTSTTIQPNDVYIVLTTARIRTYINVTTCTCRGGEKRVSLDIQSLLSICDEGTCRFVDLKLIALSKQRNVIGEAECLRHAHC